MSQEQGEKSGIYRILSFPGSYSLFQDIVGQKEKRIWPDIFAGLASRIVEEPRILDIGCGPGALLREAIPKIRPERFVGLDPSSEYIRQASRDFPKAKFSVGTIDSCNDLGKFDVVILSGVLHHVNDDECSRIIEFSKSALRPGGYAISVDPVVFKGQHVIAGLLARADRGNFVRPKEDVVKMWHSCFSESNVEAQILGGYLRVPYNHLLVTSHKT